ncbi:MULTISPECIES: hypothetical protein [Bacillus cereus group]|uniref:hypothetical protein n=1 Tax=Bacillus cereus group TaxID=86661 RepID=UPI000BEB3EB8|nr:MULTISPECIES: hypothetical protein [Bacillus cereus group]PEG03930.1 hypothetical protein CON54_16230 [Bacillus cereus]PGS60077.1 hypothetical protein COC66_02590 [Bacillus cereus]PGW53450.1 hypothetical protein COE14_21335 [Bacillus thuringiensis]
MEDIEQNVSIDLFGHVKSIRFKDSKLILFSFIDEIRGELLCIARKNESILYYQIEGNKRYHLQVDLKGFMKESEKGERYLNNSLYVKKVYVEKE